MKVSVIRNCFLLLILLCQPVFAQEKSIVTEQLLGSWEGAFIKNNSYQKLEIDFSNRDGKIFGLQIMEEWHPTFGEFEIPIEIDSMGTIRFGTGYGKAVLTLDYKNQELIGQLENFNPSIYVHLKKTAKKPSPNYVIEDISIQSGNNMIAGHLHTPNVLEHKTAIIIVGGRGCYADETRYNLYAKFLRKYGISVLAYQKRGTGRSSGDCSKATIQDLANDLVEVGDYLKSHPNGYKKIGVLGISAGAWTMAKAEEVFDFDFMMSIVGPSTSVKEQQFQSMEYGAQFYKLDENATKSLREYTSLMFDATATDKDFSVMNRLLATSEKENWKQLLDDTDIPKSSSDIDYLWVRRHRYDPKESLSNFSKPFLAIYGDRDWIVPYRENVALLKDYFSANSNKLTTTVAFNAEHGMEMEAKMIDLGNDQSYWHFYRISSQVKIEIADFLFKHNLAK